MCSKLKAIIIAFVIVLMAGIGLSIMASSVRSEEATAPACEVTRTYDALVAAVKDTGIVLYEIKNVPRFMEVVGPALPEEGRTADRIVSAQVSSEVVNVAFFKDGCLIGILPGVSASEWNRIVTNVDGQEVKA